MAKSGPDGGQSERRNREAGESRAAKGGMPTLPRLCRVQDLSRERRSRRPTGLASFGCLPAFAAQRGGRGGTLRFVEREGTTALLRPRVCLGGRRGPGRSGDKDLA